jgi:hypothetical protein
MVKILTSEHTLQPQSIEDCGFEVRYSKVDSNRLFIPEQYTQLYHCDAYSLLSDQQKIRYNQLFAARTNEQFMLFESGFTKSVMESLLRADVFNNVDSISNSLILLLKDEERHFDMFRRLNQHCLPELYVDEYYLFLKIPNLERVLLKIFCRYPHHLHALVWLVLLMEEHAVRFSKDVIQNTGSRSMGSLDNNFVNAHKAHLKDEARHVHIDADVLDYLLTHSTPKKSAINSWLLKLILQETLKPKQAGLNVIKRLVLEFPELSNISKQLINAVRSFKYDPCMMPMFADRNLTPVSKTLLDLHPDFEKALVF